MDESSRPFQELKDSLTQNLLDPNLLASRDQMRSLFSPALSYGRHFGPPSADVRQAAVMIRLEPRDGLWTIPLTVRPDYLQDHPGQISLPGGRLEGRESHEQAAKREFEEELGVPEFCGDVIGELRPLFVFNSNYFVRPFVSLTRTSESYQPCQREVARLIHLPVSSLLNPSNHIASGFSRGQVTWQARAIQHQDDLIWGATAILLGELAALLSSG